MQTLRYGDRLSIIVIIGGNQIGDPSSNPGWDCVSLCTNFPKERHESMCSSPS